MQTQVLRIVWVIISILIYNIENRLLYPYIVLIVIELRHAQPTHTIWVCLASQDAEVLARSPLNGGAVNTHVCAYGICMYGIILR